MRCRRLWWVLVLALVVGPAEAVEYRVDEKAVPLAWLSNRYFTLKDPVG